MKEFFQQAKVTALVVAIGFVVWGIFCVAGILFVEYLTGRNLFPR